MDLLNRCWTTNPNDASEQYESSTVIQTIEVHRLLFGIQVLLRNDHAMRTLSLAERVRSARNADCSALKVQVKLKLRIFNNQGACF